MQNTQKDEGGGGAAATLSLPPLIGDAFSLSKGCCHCTSSLLVWWSGVNTAGYAGPFSALRGSGPCRLEFRSIHWYFLKESDRTYYEFMFCLQLMDSD